MEKEVKFYPNTEYNRRRRTKYFVLFALMVVIFALMDAWFVREGMYYLLVLNAFVILFIALTPTTLRENPVNGAPVLTVSGDEITVMGKKISRGNISGVKATVYLGKVGNMVENREFLEKTASSRPPENMLGMIEFFVKQEGGKSETRYAVINDVVEALTLFVKDGKVNYKLGYNLGKDYRPSTFNLKDLAAPAPSEVSAKSKIKQLI